MNITGFYQKHFGEADNLILNLELTVAVFGCVFILLNALTFQYRGEHYLSYHWAWLAPLLFATALFSNDWLKITPNLAFILKSYCLYLLGLFVFLIMIDGMQYTPFPTIDNFMSTVDQTLRIKETAMLQWVHVHPLLMNVLRITYHTLWIQWLLAPALLFFLLGKKQVYLFLVISLLAFSIEAGIYYFFPTIGPASIYNNILFSEQELNTMVDFKQIHQYLLVGNFDNPFGSCPAFHVLLAVIAIFVYRKAPLAIFIPTLLFNLTAIISTLLLGWSYAINVTVSIVIGLLAIYCGRRLLHSRLFNNT